MSDPTPTEPSEVREIRINPIVPSESVLVATARSMRPKKAEELAPRDTRKHVETCPFCRGNEDKTPPLILSWPAEGDWQIRMVENLYPVLGDDREQAGFNFGLQQTIDGYGRHEVIIDHHEHGIAVQDMAAIAIPQTDNWQSDLRTKFEQYNIREINGIPAETLITQGATAVRRACEAARITNLRGKSI